MVNDSIYYPYIYNNLGNSYAQLNQIDSALEFYNKGLKLAPFAELRAQSYAGISSIYEDQLRYDSALFYMLKAQELINQSKDIIHTYQVAISVAELIYHNGRKEEGLELLKTAVSNADSINSDQLKLIGYTNLVKLARIENNTELLAVGLDSLLSINKRFNEKSDAMAVLQVQHQYDNSKAFEENTKLKVERLKQQAELDTQHLINIGALLVGILIALISTYILFSNNKLKKLNIKLASNQQELQVVNQRLQELNQSRLTLIGALGHDLRGPIGNLTTLSKIAKEEIGNQEELEELLQQLQSSSEGAMRLLEEIVSWAQEEKGLSSYKEESIHLNSIITEIIGEFEPIAQQKTIELIAEVSSSAHMNGDRRMIRTILRNLTSNALKFTHKQGKIAFLVKETNDSLEVSISDDGIGIPKEIIQQIINKEHVGSESRQGTMTETGTGLGLYLVQKMLGIHNAELKIESDEGKGSTFTMIFPA